MSAFIFIIFVWIFWDALETLKFKISFFASDFGMYSKENCLFQIFSFIVTTLGWFLYCSIIRKIESSVVNFHWWIHKRWSIQIRNFISKEIIESQQFLMIF